MRPIEIIAECGINHQGNMQLATAMINWAKHYGADTAKFQYYDPEVILDSEHPELKPWWPTILKARLRSEDVVYLKGVCDKMEIGFLCSVFDPADVALFEEIGVERYKIASLSMYNQELAEAIAKTGKPVLVSYGHYNQETGPASIRSRWWQVPIKKLYCVSQYPAPLSEIEFQYPDGTWIFQEDDFYGFSDHTQGLVAPIMAMAHGARMIEKHFTLDRTFDGPDHVGSADRLMLSALCKFRDGIEEMLYKCESC